MVGLGATTTSVPISDEELVDRTRKGDAEAFDQLYERFFRRIYQFVDKRLNNRADTEETVQEVFINVFNSIDSYRGEAPFAAWVFGLTRRTIANRFKKKRHATVPLDLEEQDYGTPAARSTAPSPLEMVEYEELISQIENNLNTRLTEEQRKLFQLHHNEDLPIREIAVEVDRSENAVKSNLYRTRKLLLAG